MKHFKASIIYLVACCMVLVFLPLVVSAQDPNTYLPTLTEIGKHKAPFDDPRPFLKDFGMKQIVPKDLYDKLTYDEGKMKSLWAEVVGFRAPDVVGKIAPEIKPGKYTYRDLDRYPGFKELMWPDMYKRIKPGGPPHAGNIAEFEIIPTRQYYWALPVAEETKKNEGKTKLDKNGYWIWETWEGGVPFPKPSGPFKAMQIMYNLVKRYHWWEENMYHITYSLGYNKHLKLDQDNKWFARSLALARRRLMSPYGWFDKLAMKQGESTISLLCWLAPRDAAGMVYFYKRYLDPRKPDSGMIYIPSMRRIRKMTSTDTQDPVGGQDTISDDYDAFRQKISPDHYPYKYEVLEEREYLVVAPPEDGSEYVSSEGLEFRNMKMERRPLYVLKLTQLDPNYVYKYRLIFIDKETFIPYHSENYDQRGRLYRTWDSNWSWHPDMGMHAWYGTFLLLRDHVDLHSTLVIVYNLPALWNREDVSVSGMERWMK